MWSWSILRRDYRGLPSAVVRFFDFAFDFPGFHGLLMLRLAASCALLISSPLGPPLHALVLGALLLLTVLINLRWRGTFNGGSDAMTLLILTGLFVSSLSPESSRLTEACLWYVALQTCLSYLIAGWVKLRDKRWRKGEAIRAFLRWAPYDLPAGLRGFSENRGIARLFSWIVILFECAFPLSLSHPDLCLAFLSVGFAFHLGNVYAFGLNRFLLSWSAAYPALYFCSQLRSGIQIP